MSRVEKDDLPLYISPELSSSLQAAGTHSPWAFLEPISDWLGAPRKDFWRLYLCNISSVQFSRSVMSSSLWPHGLQHTRPPCPSPTPRACSDFMTIESVMPSNHLILCHPLLLRPSIFPSIRVFSNESALRIRWPKYWSFSFNTSPSSEHSGLISFRMD